MDETNKQKFVISQKFENVLIGGAQNGQGNEHFDISCSGPQTPVLRITSPAPILEAQRTDLSPQEGDPWKSGPGNPESGHRNPKKHDYWVQTLGYGFRIAGPADTQHCEHYMCLETDIHLSETVGIKLWNSNCIFWR
ncbi:Protein CBG17034 [Caenorhabditis briggsae]|uniref:Protein CBG17034 n=1 Tax=Caenorhabditis briggsae TaxID=6238 RepID=A8XQB7_CAEBR|nr:Protein CBG17034 [Caenorhabditis briggsae]CAP34855.2 Protein CBG17034 [Caenorhabditis briggsae]